MFTSSRLRPRRIAAALLLAACLCSAHVATARAAEDAAADDDDATFDPPAGLGAGNARHPGSARDVDVDVDAMNARARSLPGGGLHSDVSIACSACAASMHAIKRLKFRPRRTESMMSAHVDEVDPATGETRNVPYHASTAHFNATLEDACDEESLRVYDRKSTWLGDVAFVRDDVPWGDDALRGKRVDADLALVCARLTTHYRDEIAAHATRRDPSVACVEVGRCGERRDVWTEVLEAVVKLSTRPTALIRMAPVWLSSFALPLLFRSMFFPPREYANIADAVREAASGGGLGEKRGGGKKRR